MRTRKEIPLGGVPIPPGRAAKLPLGEHPLYGTPLLIDGEVYAFKQTYLTNLNDYYWVAPWEQRHNRYMREKVLCSRIERVLTAPEVRAMALETVPAWEFKKAFAAYEAYERSHGWRQERTQHVGEVGAVRYVHPEEGYVEEPPAKAPPARAKTKIRPNENQLKAWEHYDRLMEGGSSESTARKACWDLFFAPLDTPRCMYTEYGPSRSTYAYWMWLDTWGSKYTPKALSSKPGVFDEDA